MLTAVLFLWIYVVYNKNRYILALMSVCYVAEVAGVVTILGISFKTYQGSSLSLLPLWKLICFPSESTRYTYCAILRPH